MPGNEHFLVCLVSVDRGGKTVFLLVGQVLGPGSQDRLNAVESGSPVRPRLPEGLVGPGFGPRRGPGRQVSRRGRDSVRLWRYRGDHR